MTGFLGADVEAMTRLANRIRATADGLRARARDVNAMVATTAWRGPDAQAFTERWRSTHGASLEAAACLLEELGAKLRHEADQQRAASDDLGGGPAAANGAAAHAGAEAVAPGTSPAGSGAVPAAGGGVAAGPSAAAPEGAGGGATSNRTGAVAPGAEAGLAAPAVGVAAAGAAGAALPFAFLPGLPKLTWPWQPVAEGQGTSGGDGAGRTGGEEHGGPGGSGGLGVWGKADAGLAAEDASGRLASHAAGAGAGPGGTTAAGPSGHGQAASHPGASPPAAPTGGGSGSVPVEPSPAGAVAGTGAQGFSPANVVKAIRDHAPDPRFIAGSFVGAGALTAAQVLRARRDRPGEYLDAGMEQRTGLLGFLSRATGAGGRHHSVTVGLDQPSRPAATGPPSPSRAWSTIGVPPVR